MQDARMIGVLDILHVQLPVVVHELAIAPEHTDRTMEYPGDVRGHAGTQPVGEWRHMRGEGGKHQAMQDLDAQALQAMRGKVEVWRQAPLVANAVPKRHATQAAVQIKGPVMVGTGKLLRVSALGDTEEGAALGTAGEGHPHIAPRGPGHDEPGVSKSLGFL